MVLYQHKHEQREHIIFAYTKKWTIFIVWDAVKIPAFAGVCTIRQMP